MKRLPLITLIVALMLGLASGCKSSEQAVQARKQADSLAYVMATEMVDSQRVLFTADKASVMNQRLIYITPNTNFIVVDGDKGTVQFSPAMGGGPNGVGGFTVTGTVTNYKVKRTKKGDVIYSFHLQSIAGSCDVNATIARGSNSTTAYVQGTFHRGKITLYGTTAPSNASIFEGRTPF